MKISFITTCRHNVGDDFVREGIRAVLDDLVTYEPYLIHKHTPETVGARLPEDSSVPIPDKILDADVVVQCGAPVYWNLGTLPRHQCFSEDWIQPLWYERIARIYKQRPVLNIAAGACQRYTDDATSITSDPGCCAFIRNIHRFCAATTVRDRLALDVLETLGLQSPLLACASIHSWRRHPVVERPDPKAIAVNYMPAGGHLNLDGRVDAARWEATFRELVTLLGRRGYEPVFIAHDEPELHAMSALYPNARVHHSSEYADYFGFYGRCAGGILNRIHGAAILGARGAPAIALGNDSRTRLMDELRLPRYHVADVSAPLIVEELATLMHDRQISGRLLQIEQDAYDRLKSLVANTLC
jgi:hypothetical protein